MEQNKQKQNRENRHMEEYQMWLCSVPGLYRERIRSLVSYFGTAKAVYEAPESEFELWKRTGNGWSGQLLEFRKKYSPEEVWHRALGKGINFISREREGFPERLRALPDCPEGLFFRGKLPEDGRPAVAIVGARQCSNYGRAMARELSEALTEAGVQVVSGLALGIDGIAQKKCVSMGGSSFGILGCGVDVCYPKENFDLYSQITERGGLISEFPMGTQPMRLHFPLRNRIISGLSEAVVVVEARERSGSLITADLALEQGRDVYAFPGRNTDALSQGCNRLIEQGAGLLTSPESLLRSLNLEGSGGESIQKRNFLLHRKKNWCIVT